MKLNIMKKMKRAAVGTAGPAVRSRLGEATLPLLLFVLFAVNSARAQTTSVVRPRQQLLLNNVALAPFQNLNTNDTGTNLPYACWTNTLIPFSGAHAIGITAQIVNTNNFAATSNLVLTIYPAYDTGGGNSNGIGMAYGTNFSSTPLLTWTISYKNSSLQSTNLMTSLWEPATALGYTVSNATGSNIALTLVQSVVP